MNLFSDFAQDFRHAIRMLMKHPGFTLTAVFMLALGICGVTAQFSVIDAALLKGLPFTEPDRLVRMAMHDPSSDAQSDRNLFVSDAREFAKQQQSFTDVANYNSDGSFILTIKDTAQRFSGSHVTSNFFTILGVKPALGRDFVESDNTPEAERVTVISDRLWKDQFAGDPNVVGRMVRLNGKPATVIGVMPEGFRFPRDLLWMPLFNEYPIRGRTTESSLVLARLKPGISYHRANVELQTFLDRQAKEYPDTNKHFTVARVEPLLYGFVGKPARQLLTAMFGAVLAVLLIACANVMNMQFARATVRWRELAVRAAMGASRPRLVRQMLIESLALGALGGAAGTLLAWQTIGSFGSLLRAMPGGSLPPWMQFDIDARVLGFTIAATMLSVALAGLLPALLASRTNLVDALKEAARGNTGGLVSRLTSGLAIGQIALTSALLVSSLLLIESITNQSSLNFGYDLDSVLAGRMNLRTEYQTFNELLPGIRRILSQVRSDESILSAAFTTRRNMMTVPKNRFEIEGKTYADAESRPEPWVEVISDRYFETLGLHPISGREFEPGEKDHKSLVALVNETFARKNFPQKSPLGQRIRSGSRDPWRTIVGVVPDTLMQGPTEKDRDGAGIFLPLETDPEAYLTLVVRGREPADRLGKAVGRALAKVSPNLAIYDLGTPRDFLARAVAQGRALAALFSVFASISIVLSAIGLYGVMAFAVGRRTQEIGIRMALGAQAGAIMRMTLAQGLARLAAGLAIGICLALVLAKLGSAMAANILYKVDPHDPKVYIAVAALLAAATLVACWLPARRAAKVDPMTALRSE